MTDRPMSVLLGKDAEAIEILLDVHSPHGGKILDCTYNKGVMWKGSRFRPFRMDVNPGLELDACADFRRMPFADGSFDVIVFDPPHLPHAQDSPKSTVDFPTRYGCDRRGDGRDGDNVNKLFRPFLTEAKRVLTADGIVLAKISDIVHNHRYQWQHVTLVNEAMAQGMTPCDMLIKRDPSGGRLKSGRWKNVKHLRRCHSYWIVIRNSSLCENRRGGTP